MIKKLYLKNYRGFDKHELPLAPLSIIVGKNNAGKSTIVEALRLVSIVVNKYKNLHYNIPSQGEDIPKKYGVSPSIKNFEIDFSSIFYQYENPPAKILAEFDDGASIEIFILPNEKIHAAIYNSKHDIIRSKSEASKFNLPTVSIMPQVAPLLKKELIRDDDYIQKSMSSSLSPLHFRNQLRIYYKEFFKDFQRIVSESWLGVQVRELAGRDRLPGEELSLLIRNDDFVAEAASMGHGLQMWLQTMWFICYSKNSETIILDEPDVYMHPDLQRKLIRFIRNKFPQVILTSHSVEIISEVEPNQILIVDRLRKQSNFANSFSAVQKVLEKVGSIHNIQLTRLWNARKAIAVEGDDIKFLKIIQDILFPNSQNPIDIIPNFPIGGWGGWTQVLGSKLLLKNAMDEAIILYCILDQDYHTEEEIKDRYIQAKQNQVELHIWTHKEIENYAISPEVIYQYIYKNYKGGKKELDKKEIEDRILSIQNEKEDDILDNISSQIKEKNRNLTAKTSNQKARKIISETKNKVGNILPLVSGKDFISELSKWSQENYQVSFNALSIFKVMKANDIPDELVKVIECIEYGKGF